MKRTNRGGSAAKYNRRNPSDVSLESTSDTTSENDRTDKVKDATKEKVPPPLHSSSSSNSTYDVEKTIRIAFQAISIIAVVVGVIWYAYSINENVADVKNDLSKGLEKIDGGIRAVSTTAIENKFKIEQIHKSIDNIDSELRRSNESLSVIRENRPKK